MGLFLALSAINWQEHASCVDARRTLIAIGPLIFLGAMLITTKE